MANVEQIKMGHPLEEPFTVWGATDPLPRRWARIVSQLGGVKTGYLLEKREVNKFELRIFKGGDIAEITLTNEQARELATLLNPFS